MRQPQGVPRRGGAQRAVRQLLPTVPPLLGKVIYTELALDFESHTRQVLSLRERAHVLREAVDLLQPLLAGGTVLEGDFRWMWASLVPLGGFRSMGRTERPVFACRLDMPRHMQQLQQHCLELWTRRLSNPGAGRKDYFLAGYLPRRPGGG